MSKPNKKFRLTLGKDCELIILNFYKPHTKVKHEATEYIIYECKLIRRNGKDQDSKHVYMMFPGKTAWVQTYEILEKHNMLHDKNVHLIIKKLNNYHYDILPVLNT